MDAENTEINSNLEATRTYLEKTMMGLPSNSLENNRIYMSGVIDTLLESEKINEIEHEILMVDYGV